MAFLRYGTGLCTYFHTLKCPRPLAWVFGQGKNVNAAAGETVSHNAMPIWLDLPFPVWQKWTKSDINQQQSYRLDIWSIYTQ